MAGAATAGGNIFVGLTGWFSIVWVVAAIYLVGAILISIICFFIDRSVVAGILAGVGIGIVALGVTCFANI
jgi:ABC-type multidrug transport system permease subunit